MVKFSNKVNFRKNPKDFEKELNIRLKKRSISKTTAQQPYRGCTKREDLVSNGFDPDLAKKLVTE